MAENKRVVIKNCKDGPCPAFYAPEGGTVVVQGYKLNPESRSRFSVPENEEVVEVPLDLLLEAAQKFSSKVAV